MQLDWRWLLGGAVAAGAGWWFFLRPRSGGEAEQELFTRGQQESGFGGGGGSAPNILDYGDSRDTGAAPIAAVWVAKTKAVSGPLVDTGGFVGGDASPFIDSGPGLGFTTPKLGTPRTPIDNFSPELSNRPDPFTKKSPTVSTPAPEPPPPPLPTMSAINVAKIAARPSSYTPVSPLAISDMGGGRLDAASLGSGGLFGNLPIIKRSPAVTTTGAAPPPPPPPAPPPPPPPTPAQQAKRGTSFGFG